MFGENGEILWGWGTSGEFTDNHWVIDGEYVDFLPTIPPCILCTALRNQHQIVNNFILIMWLECYSLVNILEELVFQEGRT